MAKIGYPSLAFRGKTYKPSADNREEFDVILITGDAFVDHPAFPAAVVCRSLEKLGCTVAVIAQPDWKNPEDFRVWGKPRKFFAVAPGAMDSMVANFTATRMPRSNDRLSPGGKPGLRPKRAVQVYTQMLRRLFPGTPLVIGGIEASLRRFVHYDFWEDKLRDPVLMNAPADLLVYGMAESVLPEIVKYFSGKPEYKPARIAQTCIRVKHNSWKDWLNEQPLILPSVEECRKNADSFLKMSLILDKSVRPEGSVLIQQHSKGDIICFPPDTSTYQREIENFDELRFNRQVHPLYKEKVPALEPVQFSIQSHRGCVGACSFCALALHQGRFIRSRDSKVLVDEAKNFLQHP
ncbi:MAG: YgiQ family radical SAM protein, partial [Candidatus Rifleibacteriota bacterium]